jgi:hypothetical protein
MHLEELGFLGDFSGGLIVLGEAFFVISLPMTVEMRRRLLSSPWAKILTLNLPEGMEKIGTSTWRSFVIVVKENGGCYRGGSRQHAIASTREEERKTMTPSVRWVPDTSILHHYFISKFTFIH